MEPESMEKKKFVKQNNVILALSKQDQYKSAYLICILGISFSNKLHITYTGWHEITQN